MSRIRFNRAARVAGITLAALLMVPATALAADPVTVSGLVTRDGAPAAAVEVALLVDGSDLVFSATTGDDGAFAVAVEAGIGSKIAIRATGPTVVSETGENGCVRRDTPIGSIALTLDTLTPDAVTVPLDAVISSSVCSATGRPDPVLPATDGPDAARPGTPGTGAGAVLAALAILAGLALVTGRHRAGRRSRA
jgi:hypothetical protein